MSLYVFFFLSLLTKNSISRNAFTSMLWYYSAKLAYALLAQKEVSFFGDTLYLSQTKQIAYFMPK